MRSSAIFGLFGAALLALFVGYFGSSGATVVNGPQHIASSTGLAILPAVTLPSLEVPMLGSTTPQVAITTATSTAPSKTKAPSTPATPSKPVATAATPPAQTTTTTTVITTPAPTGDLAAAATEVRGALVNILCIAPVQGGVESISGSGIIIDPRGIILTNAHIGQYFLLANRGVSCTIRTGSPAQAAYKASLVFVSPAWIHENATVLTQSEPTGTGEHDIALLSITRAVNGGTLPSSFAYAPLAQDPPSLNESVVIGSYAAQFLQSSAIENSLYPTIVYGSIKEVFTFETNTVDIVSLGGSAAAQEGSSGGGALDSTGTLVATITTSTTQGDTSSRELNAITASYIRRDYAAETGYALATLLAEQPSTMITNFAPQIPALEAVITADL